MRKHISRYQHQFVTMLVIASLALAAGLFYSNSDNPNLRPAAQANGDSDQDGILDINDNCPQISNPGQEDSNGNEVGDACDVTVVYKLDEFEFCLADGEGQLTSECETIVMSGTTLLQQTGMEGEETITEMLAMNLTGTSDLIGDPDFENRITMKLFEGPAAGFYSRIFDDLEFPAFAEFEQMGLEIEDIKIGEFTGDIYTDELELEKTEDGIIKNFPPLFSNPLCSFQEIPFFTSPPPMQPIGFIVKNCDEFSLWPIEGFDGTYPEDGTDSNIFSGIEI